MLAGVLLVCACPSKEDRPRERPATPEASSPSVTAPVPEPQPRDAGGAAPSAVALEPPVAPPAGHLPPDRTAARGDGGVRGAIAKLKVTGSVGRGDVERVLRAAVPKLQACRAANGAGKGALELEVTFGDRGWVSLAEVKRSTVTGGDPQMCVVTELRALRFPKPSDGQDATASFALQFK